ncbi:MAG: glycosyltransferase family 2 protein [Candidatus Sumerlaeia bacterium]|nr:glycosyltransferase family 2 protein [Candidatus Sumerlaeia bacterium]
MSDAPLVSILVPCRNARPWIAACLESALAQTWSRVEVIVVENGSTDGTREVLAPFVTRGVRIIEHAAQGAAAARNRALAEARGDLFQFLDADDLLAPDKIARQMDVLRSAPPDAVATGEWARFYDDPNEARFAPEPTWNDFAPVDFLRLLYAENRMMHPAAWLVPRAVAERAGPWDESLSLDDDGEYFARVVLAASRVVFAPGARSYYRSGQAQSLSQARSARAWESQFHAIENSSAALLARDDSPATCRACADRWQRFVFAAYPEVPYLRARAAQAVGDLGGSDVVPDAGPMLQPLQRVFGWRAAARARRLVYRLGYRALGHRRRARRLARRPPEES